MPEMAIKPGTHAPTGPLSGLLVADFSRILAGPYSTMLLADLGAEVVKVESPTGDDTRTWQPPVRDGVSTYYLGVNRNKRSVALDLKDPNDVAAAQELARRADILVENFKPGGLGRFGLDYATVAAGNPGIIYASISGFGSAPEGAVLPGYDLIVQAISGLMSLTGGPDGEPFRAGISVFDVMAGLHATIGVLAALRSRQQTGHGQCRRLGEVLGVLELADDPRFSRNEDRTTNRDLLRPLLVARLATRTKMEWFRDIIAAGVPCGPINTIDGGVAFAEEVGLDPVVRAVDDPDGVPSVRHPIRLSETPPDYRLPPPDLDEHGAEIRTWLSTPPTPAE